MTYEEAINPVNAAPFDPVYVWRVCNQRLCAGRRSVQIFVASFESTHLFKVCTIAKDTTVSGLRLQIERGVCGPLFNTGGNDWKVGTPDDMIQSVFNSGVRL